MGSKIADLFIPMTLFLVITACSSTPPETRSARIYSDETQRTFDEIERDQLLEYYRQLRAHEMQEDNVKTPPPTPPAPVQRARTVRPESRPTPPPQPQQARRQGGKPILVNPEELKKEIDQNLVFFCMRTRQEARFQAENSCQAFTENLYQSCREQFDEGDRRLFNCIRTRLK